MRLLVSPSRHSRLACLFDCAHLLVAVAEKLKQEGRAELSQAELTEELEDEEGNVYNRKVRFFHSPPP